MPARAAGMALAAVEPAGRADTWPARRRRGREGIAMNEPKERIRYDANVCGGDFGHVRERFDTGKRESLTCRPERRMFDGKDEVREPNHTVYAGPQRALAARRPIHSRSRCGSRPKDARCGG